MFLLVAAVALLCAIGTWAYKVRVAGDSWGYEKLGVNDGSGPVYYVVVRGVGDQPTFARIVRFTGSEDVPVNALEIAHKVSPELPLYMRWVNRTAGHMIIQAGRNNIEAIEIRLDAESARTLFGRPGRHFESFDGCEQFWFRTVVPHLPDDP